MTFPARPSAAFIAPVLFDALCSLGEGVMITEDVRIVFVDPGCERISGYDQAALLALPSVFEVVEPSERGAVAERFRKHLSGEPQDPHYESVVMHRDGHSVPVEIAVYLQDAAAKRLLIFVRDISVRVGLERERDRLHARTVATYEDLFERAPVGYHEIDLDGRIVRVNDTEVALFGYTREEMLGRHSWEFSAEPGIVEDAVRGILGGPGGCAVAARPSSGRTERFSGRGSRPWRSAIRPGRSPVRARRYWRRRNCAGRRTRCSRPRSVTAGSSSRSPSASTNRRARGASSRSTRAS